MPLFNTITNGRFSAMLTRLFWMKEAGAAAPTLAPEIAPQIDVNQMDDSAMLFVRGERLCSLSGTAPASVGNYTGFCLNNPAGSGILAIVEAAFVNLAGAAVLMVVRPGLGSHIGTPITPAVNDTRWRTPITAQANSACTASSGALAGLPVEPESWRLMSSLPIAPRVVLHPGMNVTLVANVVNTAISNFAISWRERAVAGEELQTG